MVSVDVLVSGVVSLGVLATGFVAVCYVLVQGLKWYSGLRAGLVECRPSSTVPGADKTCARCGRCLSAFSLGHSRRLKCAHCQLAVCRHCCARASTQHWLCVSCRKLRDVRLQSGEWFYQQLRQRFRSTVAALGNTDDKKDGEVQEFMEKLVETMIGSGLDDVSLYPLSDNPAYGNFCERYKDLLVHVLRRLYLNLQLNLSDPKTRDGEAATDLHIELKDLMKQIIHDAMSQSQLKEETSHLSWPPPGMDSLDSLGQRSYEDILATAILNKVFAKYHLERPRRRKHRTIEKTLDKNSNLLPNKPAGAEGMLQGAGAGAGVEEMSGSGSLSDTDSVPNSLDDSWSDSGPMSVTIEECIEEVTTRYSSEDEEPKSDIDRFLSSLKYLKRQRAPFPELGKDIVDGGDSSSDEYGDDDSPGRRMRPSADDKLRASVEQLNPVDSWEENWLFQRRRLKTNMGTCQPVPVPMLVPHPSQDFKAMIGDVEADEISDLSDCSDSVLEDLVDGLDDKSYFEAQRQGSEEEERKPVDQQREMFLKYISEDLSNLIEPQGLRGVSPAVSESSPDTGQSERMAETQEIQVSPSVVEPLSKEPLSLSPEETDSSNSYSIAETRNLNVPVVQVDSGEGSLDLQQDSEYTVAYATLAQVRSTPSPSPAPSQQHQSTSPVPKPRTVISTSEPSELSTETAVTMKEESASPKSSGGSSPLNELSLPPKPGTIAEREHLKWEKAPPLANNPYSKENIARRQRQRMYLSRHSSTENSIEFPELTGAKEPSLQEIDVRHRRDDCNKYLRDYYVNSLEASIEEGTKPPAPQVKTTLTEPRTANQPPPSQQQQVSVRVEVEVAVSKPSVLTQTSAHQVRTVVTPRQDSEYISLPSVKELAKQFSTSDDKIPVPVSPVAVRKQPDLRLHSPVRQVHSLTARNISREIRENLRSQRHTVPVVKVAVDKDKELDSSGHVSEDSGTVSPTPTPCAPPRRLKLQEGIQFWEQLKDQR